MPESSKSNGELLIRVDERTKRIESKLDAFCLRMEKEHDDHEMRIRDREASGRIGVYADVGAYSAAAAAGVAAVLTGKQ